MSVLQGRRVCTAGNCLKKIASLGRGEHRAQSAKLGVSSIPDWTTTAMLTPDARRTDVWIGWNDYETRHANQVWPILINQKQPNP